MPHPNIDPLITNLIDNQLMYKNMQVGQVLHIIAKDAETGQDAQFAILVVSLRQEKDIIIPTFMFMDTPFTFWLPEQSGTTKVEPGTLAESGISAWLIPRFIKKLIGLGGITPGQDYLFECVGGDYRKQIIAHKISSVVVATYEQTFIEVMLQSVNLEAHLKKIEETKALWEEEQKSGLPEEISRPTDQVVIKRLQNKLEEYYKRWDENKPPEMQQDLLYKTNLLEELLQKGSVEPQRMRDEYEGLFGKAFNPAEFKSACLVIEDYCQTGGEHVFGGTGLPGPE